MAVSDQSALDGLELSGAVMARLRTSSVCCTADLISIPVFELVELLDLPWATCEEVVRLACEARTPSPTNALRMYEELRMPVSSGLSALDSSLQGGLIPGTVTEFVGPAGSGKSQFVMQISAMAALGSSDSAGGGVVVLDTEGSFSPQRLVEIVRARCGAGDSACNDMLARIFVHRVNSLSEAVNRIESLERVLIAQRVRVVIVDSIAAVARSDFSSNGLAKRQAELGRLAARLKYYGEHYEIAAIVVNQVTSVPGLLVRESRASLGVLWHHCVTTRLALSQTPVIGSGETCRAVAITKSPVSASRSFKFTIDSSGTRVLESSPLG